MPPPRKHRAHSVTNNQQQDKEVAASVLAEQNPPPSLLGVIMQKILSQNNQHQQQDNHQGGYNDGYNNNNEYGYQQQQHHKQGPPEAARHPERPVLSQAVLCGKISSHSDASTIKGFFEETCNSASSVANELDPLKGRMLANADALGIENETMRVVGTFVEMTKTFWVILEAEPPHLHEALRQIRDRLKKGAALERLRKQQQAVSAANASATTASSATTSKAQQQLLQQQQQAAQQQMLQAGAFDGCTDVQLAFYADDVIERTSRNWINIDLSDAPPSAISQNWKHLDEFVVESIHSVAELANTQQSVGGALGGVRGISAMADTARNAKLANMILPTDEVTEKMSESGFFFGLDEFVREFCTESTSVPKLYTDLVHPIEPELEY
jgi:hypothetical protein